MKILFVVNNFYASGNGLSASARRTVRYLREAGEEVRVLSGRNHEAETPQPDYVLADFHVPVFDGLVQSHGYKFARTDLSVIKEAVLWADVVHLEEPFIIQMVTARIAKYYGVPCTATYHLHPENLSARSTWATGSSSTTTCSVPGGTSCSTIAQTSSALRKTCWNVCRSSASRPACT